MSYAALAPYGILGYASLTRRPLATITASDEDSAHPASDLRSPIQGRPTRTANATGAKTWVIDAGEPIPIWALGVYNHNLSSIADIVIAGHTADSWGSPAFSATVPYHPDRLVYSMPRPQQYRYWRLSVTDASAAGGYIELGTLDLWPAWPFPQPPVMGDALTIQDPSTAQEIPHGDKVLRTLATSGNVSFSFRALRKAHALALRDVLKDIGTGSPVLAVLDPKLGLYSDTYYGTLQGSVGESISGGAAWTHHDVGPITVLADRA